MITTYKIDAISPNKVVQSITSKPQKTPLLTKTNQEMGQQKSIVTLMLADDTASFDISKDGDILEISKQGMEKSQRLSTEEETMAVTQEDQENPEEETDQTSNDLTNYSNYELSELLAKGFITSAEYFIELNRRDALKKLNLA